jgi:hypothetical protein
MNEAIHHLGNDSPSFHPVHTLIRAVGPPVLHHSKGRGRAQADPCLGSKGLKRLSIVNVSTQQSFPAEGCQPSVRVGMHMRRGQWIGGDTRTMATSHPLVS